MTTKGIYLGQSGFFLDTGATILIFDYVPSPNYSKITTNFSHDPTALSVSDFQKKPVYVFSSHGHFDHFSKDILRWEQQYDDITYILSDDIPSHATAFMVAPHQSYSMKHLTLHTLRSTDLGVAFVVEVDQLRIYHAGDLNWWHWEGESPSFLKKMEEDYKQEILRLQQMGKIDLAFVPVDPRLGSSSVYGLDYLMRTTLVQRVIPMHLWNDFSSLNLLFRYPCTQPYRSHIIPLFKQGETFFYSPSAH